MFFNNLLICNISSVGLLLKLPGTESLPGYTAEREKSLAAFRAGFKRLIIPKENEKDLVDVPSEVKEKMTIITVDNIDQVFAAALK